LILETEDGSTQCKVDEKEEEEEGMSTGNKIVLEI
jgi:hypothetical protein